MSKKDNKKIFICEKCGNEFAKWSGQCGACLAWNTLKELAVDNLSVSRKVEEASLIELDKIDNARIKKYSSGLSEFDLVLGGGIVPGEVFLLGGDPGVGKSTLLWQVACQINGSVIYIAGEESPEQIKLRAQRILSKYDNVFIIDNPDLLSWINVVKKAKPRLLIIDSIQTVYDSSLPSSPGSVLQIKHCTNKIIRLAKDNSIATAIIGHVTKEGEVAGPRTLEHMVDAVFYLEGEKEQGERFLRSNKNRFGPTDEMGVFGISDKGLLSASEFGRIKPEPSVPFGLSRTAVLEGSRTYVVEVQSLIQKTSFGFAKRNSVGYDLNRLLMMVAIASNHLGINFSDKDIFLNVAGGYKIRDPLCDLSVISALASAFYKKPLKGDRIVIGEVDLAGRIHLPSQAKKIIKDAQKLGYQIELQKELSRKSIFED